MLMTIAIALWVAAAVWLVSAWGLVRIRAYRHARSQEGRRARLDEALYELALDRS